MLLYAQLIFVGLIEILDVHLGTALSFFYTLWWWDIPAHFLGGLWAGLFLVWFGAHFKRRVSLLQCALFAFAIGVSWELFECYEGVGGSTFMSYWIDTPKDLVMDTFGGMLAWILARRSRV